MRNLYDKILTIDSATFETELSPELFKERIRTKFGLKERSIKDIISLGGHLKYSGELTTDTFKVVRGNSDDPIFFVFTRIVGEYSKSELGTKIKIKAQFGDVFYFGLIPSVLIWGLFAFLSSWTLLIGATLFVAFIGVYGKTQIQDDYNKFRSDLSFYTDTKILE